MTAKTAFAPAKVNLTLHVTGQRDDGYHLLDSLVAFADFGDHLTFAEGPEMSLTVTGSFADGVPTDLRNLVWQAANCVGWTGHITLEKNLPHGAGIGGGSSDAAAVLRTLGGGGHAVSLGADVPVCMASQYQRMQGIGDIVSPLADLPPLNGVLVNPNVHLPTPSVFKHLTEKTNPPMPVALPKFQTTREFLLWLTQMRNDLEIPALHAAPEIAQVLSAISTLDGVYLARMSGSGATCFGLFDNAGSAERAARDIARDHPDWWVQACTFS